jgi:hypothetical protein
MGIIIIFLTYYQIIKNSHFDIIVSSYGKNTLFVDNDAIDKSSKWDIKNEFKRVIVVAIRKITKEKFL